MLQRLLPTLLLALLPVAAAAAAAPPVIHHTADVILDTATHEVRVYDRLTLPPGLASLTVGAGLTIQELVPAPPSYTPQRIEDEQGARQVIDLVALGLSDGGQLAVRLLGVFHQPTDQVTFSRENVGGEITATIGDEGIYLSAGAGWLPTADGAMATFDLTVDGARGLRDRDPGPPRGRIAPHITRWVADQPSDGLNLVANRFVVHEEPVRDGVTAYTFFLEDDAAPARHLHRAHPGLRRHVRGDDRALPLRQVRHGRELVPHRLRHARLHPAGRPGAAAALHPLHQLRPRDRPQLVGQLGLRRRRRAATGARA